MEKITKKTKLSGALLNGLEIQINPKAKVHFHTIGNCKTPYFVVDDVLKNAEELRDFALSLAYSPPLKVFYPGLKSTADLPGFQNFAQWISKQMITKIFNNRTPSHIASNRFGNGMSFSILSCNRGNIPEEYYDIHSDGAPNSWLAAVLHLSLVSESRGTGFWENKKFGMQHFHPGDPFQLCRLEADLGLRQMQPLANLARKIPFTSNLDSPISMQGGGARTIFSLAENKNWKLLDFVEAKFNRLVVYPTWQFHSIVDMTKFKTISIENMRLTMNSFIGLPFRHNSLSARPVLPPNFYRTVKGLHTGGR